MISAEKVEERLSNKEQYGRLSEREYRQLMYIRAEHERRLKRKRRNNVSQEQDVQKN